MKKTINNLETFIQQLFKSCHIQLLLIATHFIDHKVIQPRLKPYRIRGHYQ